MGAFSLESKIPFLKSRLFDRAALRLMLIAGLVPNGIFLVAMPFFIAQRLITPLLYLLATAAALFLPPFCAYILFLLVAAIDLGLIISIAFHLPLHTALDSIRFLSTIDVAASAFYVTTVTLTFTMPLLESPPRRNPPCLAHSRCASRLCASICHMPPRRSPYSTAQ